MKNKDIVRLPDLLTRHDEQALAAVRILFEVYGTNDSMTPEQFKTAAQESGSDEIDYWPVGAELLSRDDYVKMVLPRLQTDKSDVRPSIPEGVFKPGFNFDAVKNGEWAVVFSKKEIRDRFYSASEGRMGAPIAACAPKVARFAVLLNLPWDIAQYHQLCAQYKGDQEDQYLNIALFTSVLTQYVMDNMRVWALSNIADDAERAKFLQEMEIGKERAENIFTMDNLLEVEDTIWRPKLWAQHSDGKSCSREQFAKLLQELSTENFPLAEQGMDVFPEGQESVDEAEFNALLNRLTEFAGYWALSGGGRHRC
eukprot:TRINITY_DN3847_c0_g1_i1.p1 TRINITY_DN3847_c0_g1~~TRINITY_DN3847_c0_g1_i1.p1  ORF type:complete len:311 (+),score=69.95 TRINITY_DN3847_c0_g1_i1:807-1739(+)